MIQIGCAIIAIVVSTIGIVLFVVAEYLLMAGMFATLGVIIRFIIENPVAILGAIVVVSVIPYLLKAVFLFLLGLVFRLLDLLK